MDQRKLDVRRLDRAGTGISGSLTETSGFPLPSLALAGSRPGGRRAFTGAARVSNEQKSTPVLRLSPFLRSHMPVLQRSVIPKSPFRAAEQRSNRRGSPAQLSERAQPASSSPAACFEQRRGVV